MSDSHHSLVAHQFDDAGQQQDASNLGIWLFLVTEVMFFGGFMLAYIIYRNDAYFTQSFHIASTTLNPWIGGANTGVLLISSLAMALGVHAAQEGKRRQLIGWLWTTIVLGSAFLAVKGFEYAEKFHHHHFPGANFHFDDPNAPHAEMFFNLYFALTGLHALHMIVAIGVMLSLVRRAYKGDFTKDYYNPVEVTGLYWHFIDIVWIFLFPLLYLVGGIPH